MTWLERQEEQDEQDRADIERAAAWTDDPIDRETAKFADWIAEGVCRWAENNPRLRSRADQIVKAVEPYLGLPRVMDTCERIAGARLFH